MALDFNPSIFVSLAFLFGIAANFREGGRHFLDVSLVATVVIPADCGDMLPVHAVLLDPDYVPSPHEEISSSDDKRENAG